jgi:serine O-acetyltransferase
VDSSIDAPNRLRETLDDGAPEAPPSAEEPDWSREWCSWFEWSPSRKLIGALRAYARARTRGGVAGFLLAKLAVTRHRFWAVVTGADVPLGSRIGGGLMLPHPNGVVIHPGARLGPNCLLFQQVTIGTGSKPGLPVLGGHVEVGPGAKILGGVRLGDHVLVGANAVVVCDVPAGSLAVGVPAVVKPRR